MSDAISYANAGRGFPGIPGLRRSLSSNQFRQRKGVSVSLRRCRFPRIHALQNILCASPLHSLQPPILSRPPPSNTVSFQNT